eukprot:scaffold1696_cov258-Pinguiococcus_pyrenoidosus.AAC.13
MRGALLLFLSAQLRLCSAFGPLRPPRLVQSAPDALFKVQRGPSVSRAHRASHQLGQLAGAGVVTGQGERARQRRVGAASPAGAQGGRRRADRPDDSRRRLGRHQGVHPWIRPDLSQGTHGRRAQDAGEQQGHGHGVSEWGECSSKAKSAWRETQGGACFLGDFRPHRDQQGRAERRQGQSA